MRWLITLLLIAGAALLGWQLGQGDPSPDADTQEEPAAPAREPATPAREQAAEGQESDPATPADDPRILEASTADAPAAEADDEGAVFARISGRRLDQVLTLPLGEATFLLPERLPTEARLHWESAQAWEGEEAQRQLSARVRVSEPGDGGLRRIELRELQLDGRAQGDVSLAFESGVLGIVDGTVPEEWRRAVVEAARQAAFVYHGLPAGETVNGGEYRLAGEAFRQAVLAQDEAVLLSSASIGDAGYPAETGALSELRLQGGDGRLDACSRVTSSFQARGWTVQRLDLRFE